MFAPQVRNHPILPCKPHFAHSASLQFGGGKASHVGIVQDPAAAVPQQILIPQLGLCQDMAFDEMLIGWFLGATHTIGIKIRAGLVGPMTVLDPLTELSHVGGRQW